MSIALEGAKLDSAGGEDIDSRPVMPLTQLVREKVQDLSIYRGVSHPVQDAARTLGTKVVQVLNALTSGDSSASEALFSKSIQRLQVSLDSKPVFKARGGDAFGDRRVLDKARRAIQKSMVGGVRNPLTFVTRLDGVSELWSLTVKVGSGLVVAPHVRGVKNVFSSAGTIRLDRLAGHSEMPGFTSLRKGDS